MGLRKTWTHRLYYIRIYGLRQKLHCVLWNIKLVLFAWKLGWSTTSRKEHKVNNLIWTFFVSCFSYCSCFLLSPFSLSPPKSPIPPLSPPAPSRCPLFDGKKGKRGGRGMGLERFVSLLLLTIISFSSFVIWKIPKQHWNLKTKSKESLHHVSGLG